MPESAINVLKNIIYTASVYSTLSKKPSSNRFNREKSKNWTPDLGEAVQELKWHMHRQVGESFGYDSAWIARQTATMEVRSVQRRVTAEKEKELKQIITTASKHDPHLFLEPMMTRYERSRLTIMNVSLMLRKSHTWIPTYFSTYRF